MDAFVIRATLAGLGVVAAAGPLGCFVLWRRMAYFGDAVAHAALLGVALALVVEAPVVLGVLAVALAIALSLSALQARGMAADTSLGVLSHGALAVGLVAVSLTGGVRVDLQAFLFGDLLAVSVMDLAVIWGGAAVVLGGLVALWQPLVLATLSPELARAAGHAPDRLQLGLTLALAVVVAVALKVVGALLITALLIIPAATARSFARSPEAMAALSVAIGAAAVVLGVLASWHLDTPTGPSIVAAAAVLFAVSLAVRRADL